MDEESETKRLGKLLYYILTKWESQGLDPVLSDFRAYVLWILLNCLKKPIMPLLVWLSWLGIGLQSERSPIQFQVKARAWVAGQTQ